VPGEDEELFPEWDEYIKLEEEAEPKTNGAHVDVDGDVNGIKENGHADETVADGEDATTAATQEEGAE